jgi:hypothetical protein
MSNPERAVAYPHFSGYALNKNEEAQMWVLQEAFSEPVPSPFFDVMRVDGDDLDKLLVPTHCLTTECLSLPRAVLASPRQSACFGEIVTLLTSLVATQNELKRVLVDPDSSAVILPHERLRLCRESSSSKKRTRPRRTSLGFPSVKHGRRPSLGRRFSRRLSGGGGGPASPLRQASADGSENKPKTKGGKLAVRMAKIRRTSMSRLAKASNTIKANMHLPKTRHESVEAEPAVDPHLPPVDVLIADPAMLLLEVVRPARY